MKKTKKGFTLVELVIVVAVMAVLVAVAIPTVGAITNSAKKSVAASNAQTIESMIKLEEAEVSEAGALGRNAAVDALNDAKLGITEGTFYYNPSKGVCVSEEELVAENKTITELWGIDGTDYWTFTFSNGLCES